MANLKVGVQVLKECIARAGSVEAGLRYYVGSGNQLDDNGYAGKVLAEQSYLKNVAGGKSVAINAPLTAPPTPVVVPVVAPPAKPGTDPGIAQGYGEARQYAMLR